MIAGDANGDFGGNGLTTENRSNGERTESTRDQRRRSRRVLTTKEPTKMRATDEIQGYPFPPPPPFPVAETVIGDYIFAIANRPVWRSDARSC